MSLEEAHICGFDIRQVSVEDMTKWFRAQKNLTTVRIGSCCMTPEILAQILDAYVENLNENGNYRRIQMTNKEGEDFLNNDATREIICNFLGKIKPEKTVLVECDTLVFESWHRDKENPQKVTLSFKTSEEAELQTYVPESFR